MDLFYVPAIGDRVRIKNINLIGTVIKGGIYCVVDIDNIPIQPCKNHMRFHYRRLSPISRIDIAKRTIRNAIMGVTKKFKF